jgi:hypothetical protein
MDEPQGWRNELRTNLRSSPSPWDSIRLLDSTGQEFCRYWFQLKPGCIFLGVLEREAGLCGFMDIYSVVIFLCPLNIEGWNDLE